LPAHGNSLQIRRYSFDNSLVIELQDPNWWQQVPVLSGPFVEVREVAACDVESLFELLTDPRVTEYISSPPGSLAAFEGFISWAHHQREAGACVCLAVVPRGLHHAIGLFQLRALEPGFRIAEWGFALGAPFWSTGVFQEAAVLVAEFAFKTIGVTRLEARAVTDNMRGNRALAKLGARGEAVLRRSFNRTFTQFLWAIIADEWRPPRTPAPSEFDAAKLRRQIAAVVEQQLRRIDRGHPRAEARPFPFFLTDQTRGPSET
jgi:RimJ/RimL family protein N-acetyltransferase